MYRNTYAEINLENLKYNIKEVIKNYKYKYYFGVVKASCYGHGIDCIKTIIEAGCNYLAVSSLDEAMEIRKNYDIPILCLGIINENYLDICLKNNITITIPSLTYLKKVNVSNLKVHLKIDTGMNRLGLKTRKEIEEALKLIKEKNLILEGIFTHLYKAEDIKVKEKQVNLFYELIKDIEAPIIHVGASEGLNYNFNSKINGCRLGIIMYGFSSFLNLKSTFTLHSEIIDIKELKKGEVVSYNGNYKALKDEKIGIVSIGYADGVQRKYSGCFIYINNKKYKIVGNICMDMLMVVVDDTVSIHDKVDILKDNEHIKYISEYINTIPYEIICDIGKRVPRVYK